MGQFLGKRSLMGGFCNWKCSLMGGFLELKCSLMGGSPNRKNHHTCRQKYLSNPPPGNHPHVTLYSSRRLNSVSQSLCRLIRYYALPCITRCKNYQIRLISEKPSKSCHYSTLPCIIRHKKQFFISPRAIVTWVFGFRFWNNGDYSLRVMHCIMRLRKYHQELQRAYETVWERIRLNGPLRLIYTYIGLIRNCAVSYVYHIRN